MSIKYHLCGLSPFTLPLFISVQYILYEIVTNVRVLSMLARGQAQWVRWTEYIAHEGQTRLREGLSTASWSVEHL